MRVWLNKYFGFSKSEFNGLLFLVIIIAILKTAPLFFDYFKDPEADHASLLAQIKKIELTGVEKVYDDEGFENRTRRKEIKYFNFDPNHLNAEGWQKLGLSVRQAAAIVNYVARGGRFYKAEDLKKMYTISPEHYKAMYPYVKIEHVDAGKTNGFVYDKKEYVKKAPVIVDINTADSATLDEVNGIGPAFARRIIKYRERLGAFYKKEQLLEVWGLDSVRYQQIKDQVKVSAGTLNVININKAQFDDLKRNPYLSFKQINAIIQYRRQHGDFKEPNDLKKIAIITQDVIEKITPYITF